MSKNAELRNCVYTVIPVIDRQLLDLPYHIHRLKKSLSLSSDYEYNHGNADNLIAQSCLRSIDSTHTKDGLLTICIGLKDIRDTDCSIKSASLIADSLLYEMPSTFLFSKQNDLIVDLQEYKRETDPRIKGASWPEERRKLEISRHHGATETIIFIPREAIFLKSPSEILGYHDVQKSYSDDRNEFNVDFRMQLTEGYFSNGSL